MRRSLNSFGVTGGMAFHHSAHLLEQPVGTSRCHLDRCTNLVRGNIRDIIPLGDIFPGAGSSTPQTILQIIVRMIINANKATAQILMARLRRSWVHLLNILLVNIVTYGKHINAMPIPANTSLT
jgi:hypothetical protein